MLSMILVASFEPTFCSGQQPDVGERHGYLPYETDTLGHLHQPFCSLRIPFHHLDHRSIESCVSCNERTCT